MTTEARVAEMLAGARCQDVHHADAYVDPWCHACRSWAETTTRALVPILDAARAGVWDECVRGLAWCLDNGPSGAAPDYLLAHNPYRIDPERKTP